VNEANGIISCGLPEQKDVKSMMKAGLLCVLCLATMAVATGDDVSDKGIAIKQLSDLT
jgi:hypothetical protein